MRTSTLCAGILLAAAAPALAADAATGRLLYRGVQPLARAPTVNGVPIAGGGCARCHGMRGEGKTEAGVSAPPLRHDHLRSGRDGRPGYDHADAVLAAIEHGIGRGARALEAAMPRYAFTPAERSAIAAYLDRLQDSRPIEAAAGVAADEIRVGHVAPRSGPLAQAGAWVRAGLEERIAQANAAGGVFGRRIEVEHIDAGATIEDTARAVEAAHARTPMLALPASLHAGDGEALALRIARLELPTVASVAITHRFSAAADATFLLPSLEAQAVAAAAELARGCAGAREVLIVQDRRLELGDLAERVATRLAQRGVTAHAVMLGAAASPRVTPAAALLLLAPGDAVRRMLAAESNGPACSGALGVLSGTSPGIDLIALPWRADGDAAALWRGLGAAAAAVLIEALQRAGRALDADALTAAVDSLRGFEAVPDLPVAWTLGRRHAISEATLVWRKRP